MTFSRSQRRRRLLLLFVALFVLAVVTQLGVGWYQRRATARSNVQEAMNEIRQELRYSDHWDLKRFRQADLSSRYYVLDRSGLVINIQDFVPELGFQADLTSLQPGIRSLTEPLTNETWRLLVVPLKGGVVVLGASPPEDFTHVDERLQENAKHFGRSLEEALKFRDYSLDTRKVLVHSVSPSKGGAHEKVERSEALELDKRMLCSVHATSYFLLVFGTD